jgi:hypothetical protein
MFINFIIVICVAEQKYAMNNKMSHLSQSAQQCADKTMKTCDSYRCKVGIVVGVTPNNLAQAKHICEMFPSVEGCVAEQACSAYFPMSTSMYQSCNQTVQCMEDSSASKNNNS